MPLTAAIFDWDGVIIDSHDQHEKSWLLLAAEHGYSITTEQFKQTFGQRNETIIPQLGWAAPDDHERIQKLGDHKEELYRKLIAQDGIQPLAGVIQTLCALRDHGIRCGVGTSTPRENVDCILELTGLGEFFGAIVSAEDVSAGKPDPEVFLKAALALATPPEECLVFEDAPVGIIAAKEAGMRSVALTNTHPADAFDASGPDLVTSDLRHLPIQELEALFESSGLPS